MATKRRAKKGARKGSSTKKKRGRKKGARRGAVTKAGKVRKSARSSTIAAALNRLESRVDVLEKNDSATYSFLLGMANMSRKANGVAPIKSLPGFVTPRLFRGGYGHSPMKALNG